MNNERKIMKTNTKRNNTLWADKRRKLKTTEFNGSLNMYKKPQPIVLKGWVVTNDFSY